MTPQELISREDFATLVKTAISRYKLSYNEDLDDIIQMVALNILKSGIDPKNAASTNIIKHTIWTVKSLKSRKNPVDNVTPVLYNEQRFSQIDDTEEIEVYEKYMTKRQREVVKVVHENKNTVEAGEALGCTKQNVLCVLQHAAIRIVKERKKRGYV